MPAQLLGSHGITPPLLMELLRTQTAAALSSATPQEHRHVFYQQNIHANKASSGSSATTASSNANAIEIEDNNSTPASSSSSSSAANPLGERRYICFDCRQTLTMRVVQVPQVQQQTQPLSPSSASSYANQFSTSDNWKCPNALVHHFHTFVTSQPDSLLQSIDSSVNHQHQHPSELVSIARCCACNFELHIVATAPRVSIDTFNSIFAKRDTVESCANASFNLDMLSRIISDRFEKKNYRDINMESKSFKASMLSSPECLNLLTRLGFKIIEKLLHPEADKTEQLAPLARAVLEEINFQLFIVRRRRETLDGKPAPVDYKDMNLKILERLGSVYTKRIVAQGNESSASDKKSSWYRLLGIQSDMADSIVTWAYELACQHSRAETPYFTDALVEIAQSRSSSFLDKYLLELKRKGVYGIQEVSEAYNTLGISNQHVPDDIIMTSHEVHSRDYPGRRNQLSSALITIAMTRKSDTLLAYLSSLPGSHQELLQNILQPIVKDESMDINSAYALLDISDSSIPDDVLIPSYELKVSDFPHRKDEFLAALKCVTRARSSKFLAAHIFEKIGEWVLPKASTQHAIKGSIVSKNENESTPRLLIEYPSNGGDSLKSAAERPPNHKVGLQNLGNTCFLNPLLQMYFSIPNLRDAVLQMPFPGRAYSLQSNSSDSSLAQSSMQVEESPSVPNGSEQSTKDTLQKQERLKLANKFVSLLRSLFQDLLESRHSYVVPPRELVEIALTLPQLGDKTKESVVTSSASSASSSSSSVSATSGILKVGRQQDMTECMTNIYDLLSIAFDALQSSSDVEGKKKANSVVKSLFEFQISRRYVHGGTMFSVVPQPFIYLVLAPSETSNLETCLEEYFQSTPNHHLITDKNAMVDEEVSMDSYPKNLVVMFQRSQWASEGGGSSFKNKVHVPFSETLEVTPYLTAHLERASSKRQVVSAIDQNIARLHGLKRSLQYVGDSNVSGADVLAQSSKFLEQTDPNDGLSSLIKERIQALESKINGLDQEIALLQQRKSDIANEFLDQCRKTMPPMSPSTVYRLHTVFVHEGESNYGHYYSYMRDFSTGTWWRYNDSSVTETDLETVLKANAYCLSYSQMEDSVTSTTAMEL